MFEFLGDVGSAIMQPLFYAVSAVLIAWHYVIDLIPGISDGWVWVLSIMGLTVTIRTLLIPLFVKQIKSSRNMQLLQPKMRELQKKYSHDRERLAKEQMELFKETGTNPFASCLPILAQMPIFLALFRVIDQAAKNIDDPTKGVRGFFNVEYVRSLQEATVFNARIADTFLNTDLLEVRILAAVLVVIMCATQFTTQRQLMAKNMPADAMSGPYAQQQKMLLYILPFVFAISGIYFPIGVLVYWVTTNLWTMGQQFYVIRNNPVPGTPAFKAKQERDQRRGRTVTEDPVEKAKAEAAAEAEAKRNAARSQPKKQSRNQRKKGGKK